MNRNEMATYLKQRIKYFNDLSSEELALEKTALVLITHRRQKKENK